MKKNKMLSHVKHVLKCAAAKNSSLNCNDQRKYDVYEELSFVIPMSQVLSVVKKKTDFSILKYLKWFQYSFFSTVLIHQYQLRFLSLLSDSEFTHTEV